MDGQAIRPVCRGDRLRLLLLGKNGQVGRELQHSLAPLGELVALDRHSKDFCGDLCDLAGLARTIRTWRPDVIINAAGYTDVDRAESEPEFARAINALAPAVLAEEAATLGAWLVHYSTDYVFDGSGRRPWLEADIAAPLNVYGRTKLEGERLIQTICERHLIFRTSWIHAASGENFISAILRLAGKCESLSVVDDQVGSPTDAKLIAFVTAQALIFTCGNAASGDEACPGIYHVAAEGEVTRHRYARWIVDRARRNGLAFPLMPDRIHAIGSADFPQAAQRPANSRLDTGKLQRVFGLTMPRWESGASDTLDDLLRSAPLEARPVHLFLPVGTAMPQPDGK